MEWRVEESRTNLTIESIINIVGAVQPIMGCPDFGRLWQLQQTLHAGLKCILNNEHPNNGHCGYLMSAKEYELISAKPYEKPEDVGGTTRCLIKQQQTRCNAMSRYSRRQNVRSRSRLRT